MSTRTVPTPHGDARLEVHRAADPMATLLLTHGAGGGIEAQDLQALAAELPPHVEPGYDGMVIEVKD